MDTLWYGDGVANERDLRLCGDLRGKRTLELGIAPAGITSNAVVMAVGGAKAIAVDPDAAAIAGVRAQAAEHEVRVECHQNDLADLGFATSGSIDVAVAAHTLDAFDDLPRLLRQAHRVLKPGGSLVIAVTHPVAAMFAPDGRIVRRYGQAPSRSFGELLMACERTNFHVDVIHELTPETDRDAPAPAVLVVRARKQGN